MKSTVQEIIKYYQDQNIFIEIIADGYALPGVGICWRGNIIWKDESGEWMDTDVGCHTDWNLIFNTCIDFIEENLEMK